jgi:hypothetical protein
VVVEAADVPDETELQTIAARPEGEATAVDDGKKTDEPAVPPVPHWVQMTIRITGHVVAALTGLALGYLIIHYLWPVKFPLPW